ncbi:unnamed protein product [Orchesella dallaii]|uniref:Uncharacterized protein n=1 Tax=Orchesella dallaii TaxID=48710 RepID=A0ABP1QZP2_9HEXA
MVVGIFNVKTSLGVETRHSKTVVTHHLSRKVIYHCPDTPPRYHLKVDKMIGQWYPAYLTSTAAKLWSDSFSKKHPDSVTTAETCFLVEISLIKEPDSYDDLMVLNLTFSKGGKSAAVEAVLVPDQQHWDFSKWGISWTSGETTLTSIVLIGPGNNSTRYSYLLWVDCDLSGVVPPDWVVLGRTDEGISEDRWSFISSVIEGMKWLRLNDTLKHQPSDCLV